MFNTATKDKKPVGQNMLTPAANDKEGTQTTVIAKGTVIEGKFTCSENVRLDGTVHGEVKVDKRLVLGDSSYVQGNINARDAAIKGKIKGDVTVKEALHLMDTAVIEGNINARTMVVEEGARYNGACKIGESAGAKSN